MSFLSTIVIPLFFTLSFVVFVWGLFLYVIAGGHDEHFKEEGKALVLYAFGCFLVVVCLTWLFNLFA